jgi:hypothetical protein
MLCLKANVMEDECGSDGRSAFREQSVWTSKTSNKVNIVQGDGENLRIAIVHPLYVGLASIYGVNNSPELRISEESHQIIGAELCVHSVNVTGVTLSLYGVFTPQVCN